jgi:hypothetical protein
MDQYSNNTTTTEDLLRTDDDGVETDTSLEQIKVETNIAKFFNVALHRE